MFCTRLKELLSSSGKTQKELAEFIGVKQNTVSSWLNHGTSPKIEQLYRIVDFFSISFDYLFAYENTSIIIDAKEILKDKLSTDERVIINTYRELDDDGKDLVQNYIREVWADHRQPKAKSCPSANKQIG